jgi:hypothetical protein
MGDNDTYGSLRQSVKKVPDADLQDEILGKVIDLHHDLLITRHRMRVQEGELAVLKTKLGTNDPHDSRARGQFYDPPV